jgi:murein DD-endopeptidase MepM/ murein hydrolase activator NlpD
MAVYNGTLIESFESPIKDIDKKTILNNTVHGKEGTVGMPRLNGITGLFGYRVVQGNKVFHFGVDVVAVTGKSVVAMKSGVVTLSGSNNHAYGYHAIIKHSDGTESFYAHMTKEGHLASQVALQALNVYNGMIGKPSGWVKQGTIIGIVGGTGKSPSGMTYENLPHLHVAIRIITSEDSKEGRFKAKFNDQRDEDARIDYNYYDVEAIWSNGE